MKNKSFPKELIEIAKVHGSLREKSNEALRKTNIEFENKKAEFCDFIGVLGELIAAFELMKKGKAFYLNDLFAQTKTPGADIITKASGVLYNIDVKTTTKSSVHIPVYKVEKSKKVGISHYWIIKVDTSKLTYISFFCSVDAVNNWLVVNYCNVKCYKKELKQ